MQPLGYLALPEKSDVFHKISHEPVRLTAGPTSFCAPRPSADGKRIFVVGEQQRAELVRYDLKSRQFVPYLGGLSAYCVQFSPDGKWVSYISYPEANLWRSRVDGTDRLQLTSEPMFVAWSAWSPDGRQLAFSGGPPRKKQQIYLLSPEGGTSRSLPAATFNAGRLSWSPDGNSIIFHDASSPNYTFLRLWDFRSQMVVTLPRLPDSRDIFNPVQSPGGPSLVATTRDGMQLMLFDFDSQKWSELLHMNVGSINWSADGQYVYFDTGDGRGHLSDTGR